MKNIIVILVVIVLCLCSCDSNPTAVSYEEHVYIIKYSNGGVNGEHYKRYKQIYPDSTYLWMRYERGKSLIISKKHLK